MSEPRDNAEEIAWAVMHAADECDHSTHYASTNPETNADRECLAIHIATALRSYGEEVLGKQAIEMSLAHNRHCDVAVEEVKWEERKACALIAEATPRKCGGSRTDGDRTRWAEHESHSDAHDACHYGLEIAAAIRARGEKE